MGIDYKKKYLKYKNKYLEAKKIYGGVQPNPIDINIDDNSFINNYRKGVLTNIDALIENEYSERQAGKIEQPLDIIEFLKEHRILGVKEDQFLKEKFRDMMLEEADKWGKEGVKEYDTINNIQQRVTDFYNTSILIDNLLQKEEIKTELNDVVSEQNLYEFWNKHDLAILSNNPEINAQQIPRILHYFFEKLKENISLEIYERIKNIKLNGIDVLKTPIDTERTEALEQDQKSIMNKIRGEARKNIDIRTSGVRKEEETVAGIERQIRTSTALFKEGRARMEQKRTSLFNRIEEMTETITRLKSSNLSSDLTDLLEDIKAQLTECKDNDTKRIAELEKRLAQANDKLKQGDDPATVPAPVLSQPDGSSDVDPAPAAASAPGVAPPAPGNLSDNPPALSSETIDRRRQEIENMPVDTEANKQKKAEAEADLEYEIDQAKLEKRRLEIENIPMDTEANKQKKAEAEADLENEIGLANLKKNIRSQVNSENMVQQLKIWDAQEGNDINNLKKKFFEENSINLDSLVFHAEDEIKDKLNSL